VSARYCRAVEGDAGFVLPAVRVEVMALEGDTGRIAVDLELDLVGRGERYKAITRLEDPATLVKKSHSVLDPAAHDAVPGSPLPLLNSRAGETVFRVNEPSLVHSDSISTMRSLIACGVSRPFGLWIEAARWKAAWS